MNNSNILIRTELLKLGIPQYRAADILNMNESALSRKLRTEIPANEQKEMIQKLRNGVKQDNEDHNKARTR